LKSEVLFKKLSINTIFTAIVFSITLLPPHIHRVPLPFCFSAATKYNNYSYEELLLYYDYAYYDIMIIFMIIRIMRLFWRTLSKNVSLDAVYVEKQKIHTLMDAGLLYAPVLQLVDLWGFGITTKKLVHAAEGMQLAGRAGADGCLEDHIRLGNGTGHASVTGESWLAGESQDFVCQAELSRFWGLIAN